ncbi:Aldo/keto reductase [Crucibulum laeve]|uniref:Aldo/keto reductase n=1 Tax=Crucibulum laeve TaxID=68775 RepID=A0A5C3M1M2_9AGAR|nr:Aldo/keto reductase [Crucibulum laeve]
MSSTTITRSIGNANFPGIGIGLMSLSGMYTSSGTPADEERLAFLDAAVERGCTFFDSADAYGDSEDLLGRWFKHSGKRDSIFLATKFGFTSDPNRFINGDPAYVKEAVEKSLKRLGVDAIDLYYLHRADSTVPIELTVGAMAELVKEGKVKHIGLSEISSATLRRAHAVHPIAAVQVEYSPFTLDIEDEKVGLLKTCRELGVKVVAYAPLGRGLLTGQVRSPDDMDAKDWRRQIPRYSKENFPNIMKITDGLQAIADRHNATSSQVAIAWVLAQGDDIITIPGTNKIKYLDENMKAASIKLSAEELAEVRKIAETADASAAGDRYPPGLSQTLFADTPAL